MSDGGDLRSQLESTLAKNKELEEQLQGYIVREVAADFGLVSPDDLTGLDLDGAKAKAEELQTARTEQQVILLKAAGLDDSKIEQVLAGGTVDGSDELDDDVAKLARQQSGTGKLPPRVDKNQFFGASAIKAHFNDESAAKQ